MRKFPGTGFPPYQRGNIPDGTGGKEEAFALNLEKNSGNVDAFETFIAYLIDLNDIS